MNPPDFDADAYAAQQQAANEEDAKQAAARAALMAIEDRNLAPGVRQPTSFVRDQAAPPAPTVAAPPVASAPVTLNKYAEAPDLGRVLGSVQAPATRIAAHEAQAVGPTTLAAMMAEREAGSRAVEGERQTALHRAMAASTLRDETVGMADETMAQQAALLQEAQEKQRQNAEKLAGIESEANAIANDKIDPDRFWNSRSDAQKVAAFIGAAVAGFAAGFQGRGGNDVINTLNTMIDRDIAQQRAAFESRRNSVDARRSLYGSLMAKYDNDVARVESTLKLAKAQKVQAMANYAAESSKSAEGMQRAKELELGLQQKATAQVAQAFPWQQERVVGGGSKVAVQLPGGAVVMLSPEKAAEYSSKQQELGLKGSEQIGKNAAAEAAAAKDRSDRIVQLDDGTRVEMPSEDAKKARERMAAVRNIERVASQIDTIRQNPRAFLPGTKERADLERLGGQFLFAVKGAEQTGALDKGSVEVTEKAFGSPAGIMSRAGQRALGYAVDARANLNDFVRASGGRVVEDGYTRDAAGKVVPSQTYTGQTVASAPPQMPGSFTPAAGSAPKVGPRGKLNTVEPGKK